MNKILILFLFALLTSCAPKPGCEDLKKENEALRAELEQYRKEKKQSYEDYAKGVSSVMKKRSYEEGVARKGMIDAARKGDEASAPSHWKRQQEARDRTLDSADSLDAINPDPSRDGFKTLRGLLEEKYSTDISEAHLTIKKKKK